MTNNTSILSVSQNADPIDVLENEAHKFAKGNAKQKRIVRVKLFEQLPKVDNEEDFKTLANEIIKSGHFDVKKALEQKGKDYIQEIHALNMNLCKVPDHVTCIDDLEKHARKNFLKGNEKDKRKVLFK